MVRAKSADEADSDRTQPLRTFLVAVGLFLCSTGFFAVVTRFDPVLRILRLEHLALLLIAASAAGAIHDHGLRRVWVFVFALSAGFGIHLGGIGLTGETPGPLFRVAWAGVVGFGTAIVLGTVGGSLGLILKRLSARAGRS